MTMEVRPGRGLPMDSKVFLPMMTWWPKVVFLKCCKSPDNFHTRWLSFPMTLLWALATIMDIFKTMGLKFQVLDSHGIEDGQQGHAYIGKDSFPERGYAKGPQCQYKCFYAKCHPYILPDALLGFSSNSYSGKQLGWLVILYDHVGRFNGSIRSQSTHGNSYIRKGNYGSIIDSVSHKSNFIPLPFQFFYFVDFVLR